MQCCFTSYYPHVIIHTTMWKSLISVKIFRTCTQFSSFSILDTTISLFVTKNNDSDNVLVLTDNL